MNTDFELAIKAATQLARMFRVIDDDDLRSEVPGVPRPLRQRALDRLANSRMLHSRKGRRGGYDSSIYDGAM